MTKRGVDVGLFHQAQAWLKIRLFSQHVCSFEVTILHIGDWSNGMIGVSKTFGGSSILSSPALKRQKSCNSRFPAFFYRSIRACLKKVLKHI